MNKKLAIIGAVIYTVIGIISMPSVSAQTPTTTVVTPVPVTPVVQELQELATRPRLISWAAQNIDRVWIYVSSPGIVGNNVYIYADFTNGVSKEKLEAFMSSIYGVDIVDSSCAIWVSMELISKGRSYFYDSTYWTPVRNENGYWEIPSWNMISPKLCDNIFIPYTGIEAAKIVSIKQGSSDWGSEDLYGRIEQGQGFWFDTSRLGAGYLVVSTASGETIFNFSYGKYSLPVNVVMKLVVGDSADLRFISSLGSQITYKNYIWVRYDENTGKWYGNVPIYIIDAADPYKVLTLLTKSSAGYVQAFRVTRFNPDGTQSIYIVDAVPTNGVYKATIDLTSPTLTHIEPLMPVDVLPEPNQPFGKGP
ncbi:MAG: hypothetical protein NTV72_00025 [Candidatus Taylorbacteria bacterium]|nr:hypothetical protein [Candidatus Taylorbacteria bacterium]